jgi:hypothetical protein
MARTAKPSPRQAPAFSAAEWAPLKEAFARVKSALGSGRLTERDLLEDMRSGRLATAARRTARDGAETFERLKPSFWKELTLLSPSDGLPVQVRGLDVKSLARSSLWFFVARSDLDKLYPVAAAAEQETEISPPRRKPGRQPTKNWKLYVAAELHRIVEIERKQPPPASHFAQLCENKLGYQPDIREVQKLLRQLL